MRGWIYVISNAAMPGLVKVGYTMKDPGLRASELYHTGTPFPYVVEYEALVVNPRQTEQLVHAVLVELRAGKEWFQCSLAQAVAAIRSVTGAQILLENAYGVVDSVEVSDAGQSDANGTSPVTGDKSVSSKFECVFGYQGACTYCGVHFSVTLTRYEMHARCPSCRRLNLVDTPWKVHC